VHLIDVLNQPFGICQQIFGFRRVFEDFADGCLRACFRHGRDPDLRRVVEPRCFAPHPLPLAPRDVELFLLKIPRRHHQEHVHMRVCFARGAPRNLDIPQVSEHGSFERL